MVVDVGFNSLWIVVSVVVVREIRNHVIRVVTLVRQDPSILNHTVLSELISCYVVASAVGRYLGHVIAVHS